MSGDALLETAVKYRVEDVKGAATEVGQVAKILAQLESGNTVTAVQLILLDKRELTALKRLALGEITFSDYLPFAEREQTARIGALAEADRRERERVESERRAAEQQREAEHLERMRDPRYRAKIREAELKEKYGLYEYVDPADYPKLMELVRMLDRGNRIQMEDFLWLKSCGGEHYTSYLTEELASRYHEIEAISEVLRRRIGIVNCGASSGGLIRRSGLG